ncbi:MAG: InlB B-repeat-containing protein [Treponema sp.]|nr:InlB B-repeat-containing protein [Treponema sp.]MCL2237407.1 InlB B-repeat-containing protein [Treponema sp.]
MKQLYIKIPQSFLVFSALLSISLLAINCENPFIDSALQPKIITFESNGGSNVPNQTVLRGGKINKPDDPLKENNDFLGWFLDNNIFGNEWDFSVTPESNMTLYAKWSDFYAAGISSINIGIAIPVKGQVPVTTAEVQDGSHFTAGNITWYPFHSPFLGGNQYTATVTLTADSGFVFTTTGFNATINEFFDASILSNTGSTVTLTFAFPATMAKEVQSVSVTSQPLTMNYLHGDTLSLDGLSVTLVYTDGTSDTNIAPDAFASKGIYTSVPNGKVLDYSYSYNNQQIEITLSGSELKAETTASLTIGKRPITTASVTVTAPAVGQNPSAVTSLGTYSNFTVTSVTWSPLPESLFLSNTVYTVSIALTPDTNYVLALTTASINGQNAVITGSGDTTTISFAFPPTAATSVNGITVTAHPSKLVYVHGENLDLSGLSVTLSYNDSSTLVVPLDQFGVNNITTSPASNSALTRSANNGLPIIVIYNNSSSIRANTNTLEISKAAGAAVTSQNPSFVSGNSYTASPPMPPATGQNIEYAIDTNASANAAQLHWQTSPNFTINAHSAATYYWYARTAENTNYLAGTHSRSAEGITFHSVSFFSEGLQYAPSQIVRSGQPATEPASNPTQAGYGFYGWLNGAAAWNFASAVTADIVLTADFRANQIFSITFAQITDLAPNIPTGLSFSRSGAAGQQTEITITATPPAGQTYTDFIWSHGGHDLSFTNTLVLGRDDIRVNQIGNNKIISLTLLVNGVPYSKNVTFNVVN